MFWARFQLCSRKPLTLEPAVWNSRQVVPVNRLSQYVIGNWSSTLTTAMRPNVSRKTRFTVAACRNGNRRSSRINLRYQWLHEGPQEGHQAISFRRPPSLEGLDGSRFPLVGALQGPAFPMAGEHPFQKWP